MKQICQISFGTRQIYNSKPVWDGTVVCKELERTQKLQNMTEQNKYPKML